MTSKGAYTPMCLCRHRLQNVCFDTLAHDTIAEGADTVASVPSTQTWNNAGVKNERDNPSASATSFRSRIQLTNGMSGAEHSNMLMSMFLTTCWTHLGHVMSLSDSDPGQKAVQAH